MPAPKLLIKGKILPGDITIHFNDTSNRKINPEIESRIKEVWAETYKTATEKGQTIYNGESYRLDSFKNENGKLKLEVSKFTYDIRSSLNKLAAELEPLGEEYYSKGMAVGGFIKTSDGKYIFGQRSGKTITKNSVDFIGGIVEDIELKTGEDLFKKNQEEIEEEISITPDKIKQMYLVCLVTTPSTNVIHLTSTELNISSDEVTRIFEEHKNDDEMTRLIFKEFAELKDYLPTIGNYKPVLVDVLDIIL